MSININSKENDDSIMFIAPPSSPNLFDKRQQHSLNKGQTIIRPISALSLITDGSSSSEEEEDEEEDEDQQFNRISDILSNLLQEANDAVNNMTTTKPIITTNSRLLKSVESNDQQRQLEKQTHQISTRPVSYYSNSSNLASFSVLSKKHHTKKSKNNELIESFKRLDSSLAIIDSLSHDLLYNENNNRNRLTIKNNSSSSNPSALTTKNDTNTALRLTVLALLPLFHLPHILLSFLVDSVRIISKKPTEQPTGNVHNGSSTTSSTLDNLSELIVWAIIFALTNLLSIDQQQQYSSNKKEQKIWKHNLPGSFNTTTDVTVINNVHEKRTESTKKKRLALYSNKRSNSIHYNNRKRQRQFYNTLWQHKQLLLQQEHGKITSTIYMQSDHLLISSSYIVNNTLLKRRNSL